MSSLKYNYTGDKYCFSFNLRFNYYFLSYY